MKENAFYCEGSFEFEAGWFGFKDKFGEESKEEWEEDEEERGEGEEDDKIRNNAHL